MTEFQHSVKVPRLYKDSAKILKSVHDGGSLKELIFNHNKFANVKAIHALVAESIKYSAILSRILKLTNIIKTEQKFDPWLAKVLITELVFGKKHLSGNSKPVLTILKYKEDILKQLNVADVYNISSNFEQKRKDGFVNIAWSVVAAVLVVNTIIFCYVIKAWHEPEPDRERPDGESSSQGLKQD